MSNIDIDRDPKRDRRAGHSWMMIACCIPMLVIAIVLVATGIATVGVIFAAVMCTAMMAMMMRGMSDSGGRGEQR